MAGLGRALHTTSRGLVARTDGAPKLGQAAFNSEKKRIGSVFEIFGPVKSPYVVIKPASGVSKVDFEKLIGSDIYMGERYGASRKEEKVSGVRKHKARA